MKKSQIGSISLRFPIVKKRCVSIIYIYNRCISIFIFIFYILHLYSYLYVPWFPTPWIDPNMLKIMESIIFFNPKPPKTAKGSFKTEVQESSVHQWVESPPKCRKIPRREANGSWFWQAMWEYMALLERNMERLNIRHFWKGIWKDSTYWDIVHRPFLVLCWLVDMVNMPVNYNVLTIQAFERDFGHQNPSTLVLPSPSFKKWLRVGD